MHKLVALLIVVIATQAACSRSTPGKDFASAEEALEALVTAAKADGPKALVEVLGAEAKPVIDSGDPVQDRNSREKFLQEYAAAHTLDRSVEGRTTLEVGADKWPFPFPLIERDGRWFFDSTAGVEEIVNRRVGANELSTIQSCLAFVDAEREYYTRNVQQDTLLQFAQKLVSTEGRKDGLYWPTATGGDAEPPWRAICAGARRGLLREGCYQEYALPWLHLSTTQSTGTQCDGWRLRLHGA